MSLTKIIKFQASASLQRLIGRELVPNEEMAIVELVKNAYDSNATAVDIFIQPDTTKEPGFIRITDDGSGMSEDDITTLFMFAGYSDRPEEVAKARRIPTGEKGIGRFAADKLGRYLDVYTRTQHSKDGIHLTIDWKAFDDKVKQFNEVEAVYTLGPLAETVEPQGTTLIITGLRTIWDAQKIDSLRIWLRDLFDPFLPPRNFKLNIEVAGSRTGIETIKPLQPAADLMMQVTVLGSGPGRILRSFRKVEDKSLITEENVSSVAELEYLRGLKAYFLYFNKRPSKKLTHGLEAGVRVYRDGFRIEPFGSRSSDWLGIAEKKAKRAGHAHVVPSRLFGFVEISRISNPDLSDTTSRQALLDSAAVKNLVTMLREQLDALDDQLRALAEPRWRENRRREAIELEEARLHTLGVVSFGLAHEIRQPLQSIRSEAENIRTILENKGIFEPDLTEAQEAIDRGIKRIDQNISLVSEISKGSLTTKSSCDLAELIKREVSLLVPKCAALGIRLDLRAPDTQQATVNQFAVSTVLFNYIQNALQSLETAQKTGTIIVQLKKEAKFHYIEVADDGPGVAEDVLDSIFRKFRTKKTGGMGVGLYYCKTIIEAQAGEVGFRSNNKGACFWFRLPEG